MFDCFNVEVFNFEIEIKMQEKNKSLERFNWYNGYN